MSNTLPVALTRLSEYISTILKFVDPYDHYAACWFTLRDMSVSLSDPLHSEEFYFLNTRGKRSDVLYLCRV